MQQIAMLPVVAMPCGSMIQRADVPHVLPEFKEGEILPPIAPDSYAEYSERCYTSGLAF